nr:class V chitinase-like [Coffea arabica]
MVSNPGIRGAVTQSTIDAARKYGLDGLDLDWEFPNSRQDMTNLAMLFKEFLLAELPYAYPGSAIRKYVDSLNPMCSDCHGAWNAAVTGAHALVYDKNGVPLTKQVMGMPAYGRTWQLKGPNDHGAPAVRVGPGNGGIMAYKDIVDFNLANKATTVVYDHTTVSTYSYTGTNWIGYDDTRSIKNKIRFAKAQGLGG